MESTGFRKARGPVERELLRFLLAAGRAEGGYLVAYSAGPDSTALLAATRAVWSGPLHAIHVDHRLRPVAELQAERAMAVATCRRLRVGLTIARAAPGAIEARSARLGSGIEAAARDYRRAAFLRTAARRGAGAILLAHTMDDQAETTLMRMLGGSGPHGLSGMEAVSGAFWRPFLALPKSELLAYASSKGLSWSTDSTNASDSFLRNRIRGRLVPLLDAEFPGWRRGLSTAAGRSREAAEVLASISAGIAFRDRGDGVFMTDRAAFLSAHEAARIDAIVRAAGSITGKRRFPRPCAEAALKALGAEATGSYVGAGISLSLDGGRIAISAALDFPRRGGYFVVVDRPGRVRAGRVTVETAWASGRDAPGIRSDAFSFPLVIRTRKPGDSISLPGCQKALDALMRESGIAGARRDSIPVAEDRQGIVAVLLSASGGRDRFRQGPDGPDDAQRLSVIVKGV